MTSTNTHTYLELHSTNLYPRTSQKSENAWVYLWGEFENGPGGISKVSLLLQCHTHICHPVLVSKM